MKRFPIVIGTTAVGLAGVLSFHSRSALGTASQATAASAGTATHAKQGTSSSKPKATQPKSSSTKPSGTTTTSTPATTGTQGSVGSTTTSPPTTVATATATGNNEQYGYGELAVRVTVSGGKITGLQVVGLQTAESYSQQLAVQVIPYLRRQVLSAQSAKIQGITGATYTSEAYSVSVQSALDRLHVR